MSDNLTFIIEPKKESASLALLAKAMADINRLLDAVDYALYGKDGQRAWHVVSLHSSAPTIIVAPDREDTSAVEVVAGGIQSVTEGASLPAGITEEALQALKRMRRLYAGQDCAASIAVQRNGEAIAAIGPDVAAQVKRILSSRYRSLGSIQGKLEVINVHQSRTVTVWDRLSGAPVRFAFPPNETDRMKELLGRSVLVAGEIRYFANGNPRTIEDIESVTEIVPVDYGVRAQHGSIPDKRVRELGAVEWLRSA